METNVKILGWLYIVLSALGVLIGGFVLMLLLSIGVISGEEEAAIILTIVGLFVGGIMLVLSAPGIVAGIGLLKFKSWARILAIILGVLNLPGFPIGTVLGIYTLVVLLTEDAGALFLNQNSSY
ncbi:MAG: hypothetical protein JXA33_25665 [Anaerolineae bacterium]|nr:hypothetical protein [Anaerolineae bacterium]